MAFEGRDTLIISISWPGEVFQYSFGELPIPKLEKLEISGTSSSVSQRTDSLLGNMTVRTFKYYLAATDYGTGVIQPLDITATDRVTQEARQLTTGRLTVEIAKPKPPEEKSTGSTGLIIIVIVIVGLIVAVIIIMKRSAKKSSDDDTEGVSSYVESLDEIKKDTVGDGKRFYSRIYRLVTVYLEKEKGLAVAGKTGDEILRMASELENEIERNRITGWLQKALEIKYRPEAPTPADIEDTYNSLKTYFAKSHN